MRHACISCAFPVLLPMSFPPRYARLAPRFSRAFHALLPPLPLARACSKSILSIVFSEYSLTLSILTLSISIFWYSIYQYSYSYRSLLSLFLSFFSIPKKYIKKGFPLLSVLSTRSPRFSRFARGIPQARFARLWRSTYIFL